MLERIQHKWYFDAISTLVLIAAAYGISAALLPNTGEENNSALIFVAMVVVISRITDGYLYGIIASVVGALFVNIFFMKPYAEFNLTFSGYPIAMISMLIPALIVCALTGQLKKHMKEAVEREKKTKELYEINSRLEREKSAMELETAKAGIRSNILLAVSHDLRTPLTAITGSASYILSRGEKECSAENLKLVGDIKADAEWLTVMVENILSVTKLRDSGAQLTMQAEVLDEIIGSSIVKLKRRFPECEVKLELSDEVVLVSMDPLLIQQVLLNLMENVLRHAECSRPMEIRTGRQGDRVRISIRDFGKGLPADILEQIRQQKPVVVDRRGDSYRGMGIGLSVCQSILWAHHSRLCAENQPDGGVEFTFELEAVEEECDKDER